jgi:hypothetical protein
LKKTIIVILLLVVILVVGVIAYEVLSGPGPTCTSTWNCAAGYPTQVGGTYGIAGQQCIGNTTYVDCIGGQDVNSGPRNEVYLATFSSSGNITSWVASSNHYPQDINGESCAAYSGYVYCVGGSYDDAGDDVASSYYATLTSSGAIGVWMTTTPYPIPIDTESCVASSSYIYCVAGNNETDGTYADAAPSSSIWFAPISSSGIGNWSETTPYPTNDYFPDCFAAGDYAYCIGGSDSNDNSLTTSYFAPLTANGVGPWTQTTAYPVAATGQACVISAGVIYCVGGETAGGSSPTYTNAVYYAQISSDGIGGWKQSPNYPSSVGTTCAISSTYVYCVGGFDSSSVGENNIVNYASLTSLVG